MIKVFSHCENVAIYLGDAFNYTNETVNYIGINHDNKTLLVDPKNNTYVCNFDMFSNLIPYIHDQQINGLWNVTFSKQGTTYVYMVMDIYMDVDKFIDHYTNNKLTKSDYRIIHHIINKLDIADITNNTECNIEKWKLPHVPTLGDICVLNQPDSIKIQLFTYQLKTLDWMKKIEQNHELFFNMSISIRDMLFETDNKVQHAKLTDYYYDTTYNTITRTCIKHRMYSKGAILADEMGLGKTISMISLILSNPMSMAGYNNKTSDGKFKTKATLLFCPSHLAKQWESEVSKCNPLLKVILCLVKKDHEHLKYSDIIEADIVIISFQFLLNDKYYIRLHNDGYRRYSWSSSTVQFTCAKLADQTYYNDRTNSLMSVLTDNNKLPINEQLANNKVIFEFFNWHRILIDEGHEIYSSDNSSEYTFIRRYINDLVSNFRWFISGTPFVDSTSFSKVLDYLDWKCDRIITNPCNNNKTIHKIKFNDLHSKDQRIIQQTILKQLYYRNTKQSVGSEFNIPPVIEENILLELSPIERTIYDTHVSSNSDELTLRQICCHPRISDKNKEVYDNESLALEDVRLDLIKQHTKDIKDATAKLNKLKEEPAQHGYEGKVKRCQEKIKQYTFLVSLFSNIEPITAKISEDNCSICLGDFIDMVVTECGHFYCKECIQCCINKSNGKCPMCREDLTMKKIHALANDKGNKENNKPLDYLTSKYGSKIGKLIGLCRKLISNPNNRIIIFSQWDKLLTLIGSTLKENDIQNVYCKGNVHSRNLAIQSFKNGTKNKSDLRVIMLSLENAASGTNLTEATHIILMDQICGSKEEALAIENQAIARSARQGQQKQIKVIRLVTKNTIEHDIYKRNSFTGAKEYDINTASTIQDVVTDV